jgi:PilZ domain
MRSSGRIPKQIPVLLIGSDLDGRVFSEPTTTVLLSLHGAGILSRHKLSPEQELVLRWTEKNKEAEIRVVGHLGAQSGQHTYGVAFFDPHLNFWEIEFPPVTALEMELGLISVVCSACNTLEKIDDASIEADVCSTNEAVLRPCKRCGATTLWKPAQTAANQQPAPAEAAQLPLFSAPATPPPSAPTPAPPSNSIPAPAVPPPLPPAPPAAPASFYAQSYSSSRAAAPPQSSPYSAGTGPASNARAAVLTISAPAPEQPAAPPINRRKHPRVKVSYSACIRHPDRGEDIVACEDMSKGGLRFKSPKKYYAQTLIEVAVPYQPGQPAIFVPAQIVFVEELPEQRLFRYGVQYLRPTRARDNF